MFIKYQYLQHLKVNWINNNSGLFPESRSEIMGGSQTQYSILHNGKSASPQDIDNTLPRFKIASIVLGSLCKKLEKSAAHRDRCAW